MNCKINKLLGLLIIFVGIVGTIAHASLKLPQDSNLSTRFTSYKEVLFVADDVAGWEQIYRLTPLSVKKYILDSRKDFFSQVVSALNNEKNINAIHLITHGKKGKILFGKQRIDEEDLFVHAKDLEKIGKSLAPGGDIFLYGCNIAKGKGILYLDTFARFTHADVAGSNNITGALGDWKLEVIAKNGKIDTRTLRFYLINTTLGYNIIDGILGYGTVLLGDAELVTGFGLKLLGNGAEGFVTLPVFAYDLSQNIQLTVIDYASTPFIFVENKLTGSSKIKEVVDFYKQQHERYMNEVYGTIDALKKKYEYQIDDLFMKGGINFIYLGMSALESGDYDKAYNESEFYATIDKYKKAHPLMGTIATTGTSKAAEVVSLLYGLGITKLPVFIKKLDKAMDNVEEYIRLGVKEKGGWKNFSKAELEKRVNQARTKLIGLKTNIKKLVEPIPKVSGFFPTVYGNAVLRHAIYHKNFDIFDNYAQVIKKFDKTEIDNNILDLVGVSKKQYDKLKELAKTNKADLIIRKSNQLVVEKLKQGFIQLSDGSKAKVLPKPDYIKAKTLRPADIFLHPKFIEKIKKAKSKSDVEAIVKDFHKNMAGVAAVFEPIKTIDKNIIDAYSNYLKNYYKRTFNNKAIVNSDADWNWFALKQMNNGKAPHSLEELESLLNSSEFNVVLREFAKNDLKESAKKIQSNYNKYKDLGRKDATEVYLPSNKQDAGSKIGLDNFGRIVETDSKGNRYVFVSDNDLLTVADGERKTWIDQKRLIQIENKLQLYGKEAGIKHGSVFALDAQKLVRGEGEYRDKYAVYMAKMQSKYTDRIANSIKNGNGKIDYPSELASNQDFKKEIEIIAHNYKVGKIDDDLLEAEIREKIQEHQIYEYTENVQLKYPKEALNDNSIVIIGADESVSLASLKLHPKFHQDLIAMEAMEQNAPFVFGTLIGAATTSIGAIANDDNSAENNQNSVDNFNSNSMVQSKECRELFPGHSFGEWRNSRNFAAITKEGELIAWGNGFARANLDRAKEKINGRKIIDIFSNKDAFAALLEDGDVVAWGNGTYGGKLDYNHDGEVDELHNVKKIYSTTRAFAALRNDGSVVAWGAGGRGGLSDYGGFLDVDHDLKLDNLNNVKEVFSNGQAFAALKNDGSVVAWGYKDYGGIIDIDHDGNPDRLDNVKKIYSTRCAFAALRNDGSVVAWGKASCGGYLSQPLLGVKDIFATELAFAALKNDGSIIAWGDRYRGGFLDIDDDGKIDRLTDIKTIVSNDGAFAAIKNNNEVVVWGDGLYGGSHGYSSYFKRIKSKYGLDGSKSIKNIYATMGSFAALLNDGSVISWGTHGQGDMFHIEKDVKSVYANDDAYAVIKTNGKVNVWGSLGSGGKLDKDLNNVQDIKTTDDGFAAILANGDVVSWGFAKAKFSNIAKVYPDLCHKPFTFHLTTQQKEENVEIAFYDGSKTMEDTITEQRSTYYINIKLEKPLSKPVTFKLEINPYSTSAIYKEDYDIDIDEVIFEPGETQKQLSFNLYDDDIYEGNRTIAFDVVQKDDVMNRIHFYLHIQDDEPEPLPYLQGIDGIYNEGEKAQIGFKLNKPAHETIVLGCKAVDKFAEYYAQKGKDYKAGNDEYLGVLIFKPGETFKKITIETIDDKQHEPKEYLTIQCEDITDGREHVIIDPKISAAQLVIVDNDIDWDYLWDLVSNNKVVKAVVSKAALVPTISAATKVGQAILDRVPEDVKSKIANDLSKYVVALKFNQPLEKAGDPDGYKVQATTTTRALDTIKVVDAMLDPRDPSVVLLTVDSPINSNATLKIAYEPESEEDAITIPGVPPKLTQESVPESKVKIEEKESLEDLEKTQAMDEETSTSNPQQECENSGGKWVDGTCQSTSLSKEDSNFIDDLLNCASDDSCSEEASTSSPISSDKKQCESSGGHWTGEECIYMSDEALWKQECEANGGHWVQGFCELTSSNSSGSASSLEDKENDEAKEYCQRLGGEFVNGECRFPTDTSNSTSSLSSAYSEAEDQQDWCEASGGHWVDTICVYSSSISSSSLSSQYSSYCPSGYEEINGECHLSAAIQLANRALSIKGYFAYYGDPYDYDPFAWIYLSSSGRLLAKLDGMDPFTGNLKWIMLQRYFNNYAFKNGKIKIGYYMLFPGMGPEDFSQDLLDQLENKEFNVNGYFAYYGDPNNYDPYAWVYVSKSGLTVAKLDGMDPETGLLKWSYIIGNGEHELEFVEIDLDNGMLYFGPLVGSSSEAALPTPG